IIGEGPVAFSPDSKMIAFSAPDDFKFMHLEKIYLRHIDRPTEPWKKIGGTFDYDVRIGRGFGGDAGIENAFWSANGDTIYFNTGFHATTQLFAVSISSNEVKQLTNFKASTSVGREAESGKIIITYADPKTPPAQYTVASLRDVGDKSKWTQLTDPNP